MANSCMYLFTSVYFLTDMHGENVHSNIGPKCDWSEMCHRSADGFRAVTYKKKWTSAVSKMWQTYLEI